ncbi:hypothetical protein DDM60_002708 [Vibrio cholerae]|uniref:Lipoprotein n=1 Tax=Vibrio cholerae TaxID=666 RepID=A0A7Z7YD55_VIBCL|nr:MULTISPECIES: hypothetical protein [Vibrio]EGQ9107525.1 hypothetical protein [Vibrio cholerae]ELJ8564021.1 hypothetical protein [Vibrio cholerae]MBY4642195.1 hypothetical protein [Vibrio cholerae]MCR9658467.1 hypothetical protein [Vibrio cholerae]MCR9689149.1 hypothetical protein [Vibrio cholerae]
MIKKLLVMVGALSLFGCGDANTQWLSKGYSVGLDRAGWMSADADTQLGTAGHWLKSLQKNGFLNDESITSEQSLKENATLLMECLNAAMPFSDQETNYLVADCVKVNGWFKG